MTNKTTSDKYNKRAKKINSLLCVGLDSDFAKIPKKFLPRPSGYGQGKNKFPQFEFNKFIIKETHQYTAAFKMNSAFYEARGDKGIQELKMTMDYLRKHHRDIFTICDAKRADIGNTNNGYVTAIFDWLGFDAVTLHPYLGQEAVQPFLDRKDKMSIILCRTSNPGAREFQDLKIKGKPLWQVVAERVSLGHRTATLGRRPTGEPGEAKNWNKNKNCMLVVGATYPKEMKKIRSIVGDMTFLVPGVGTQGGDLKAVLKNGLNKKGKNKNLGLIINSSRSIIFSRNPKKEAQKLCEEIRKYAF